MERLFETASDAAIEPSQISLEGKAGASMPLAARMRPTSVGDVVGQDHLLSAGKPLRAAIDAGEPHAMLLHGPPGSGKTTLARIVAASAGAEVISLQAVDAGKAEVRAALATAAQRSESGGTPIVLFIDEIHRFNRVQQDSLLPAVEDGLVTLVAATTEAPWSAVSPALRSRLRIYTLKGLEIKDVLTLMRRATQRGVLGGQDEDGNPRVTVDEEALDVLAARSAGDARAALGALEAAVALAATATATATDDVEDLLDPVGGVQIREGGTLRVTVEQAAAVLERAMVATTPDQPHDLLSAYIKSIRGSDPDAAVYYLAAMLASGEDPRTVARRLVVAASEDVGLADPQALPLAVAAAEVVDKVGMPECRITLSHVTIRMALAPKSNSAYRAINEAMDHIQRNGISSPPPYLRTKASPQSRPGDYVYPHSQPGGVSEQELMPAGLEQTRFLTPAKHESVLMDRLAAARLARRKQP